MNSKKRLKSAVLAIFNQGGTKSKEVRDLYRKILAQIKAIPDQVTLCEACPICVDVEVQNPILDINKKVTKLKKLTRVAPKKGGVCKGTVKECQGRQRQAAARKRRAGAAPTIIDGTLKTLPSKKSVCAD